MERVPVSGGLSPMRIVAIVLLILAVLLLVAGVIYLTVTAGNLPSIMGRVAHSTAHRNRRATAALVLGVVLLIGSFVAFSRSRAPAR
jgi:amino acid permease